MTFNISSTVENRFAYYVETSDKKDKNRFKIMEIIFGAIFVLLISMTLLISAMRWVNPGFTAFTLQEDWDALGKDRISLRENWVAYEDIPNHAKWAVIASEDQRFFEHNGLDMQAIESAVEEHRNGDKLRGASTISQQLAKNLFLSPDRSYARKGVEAMLAISLELMWPKERILEVYLNTAEFGPGVYGIGAAARELYGKDVQNLNPYESAKLATVLPAPKRYRVNPPGPFVQQRSAWVLKQIEHLTGLDYYPEASEENLLNYKLENKSRTSGFVPSFISDLFVIN